MRTEAAYARWPLVQVKAARVSFAEIADPAADGGV